jgi:hypothetical protein
LTAKDFNVNATKPSQPAIGVRSAAKNRQAADWATQHTLNPLLAPLIEVVFKEQAILETWVTSP